MSNDPNNPYTQPGTSPSELDAARKASIAQRLAQQGTVTDPAPAGAPAPAIPVTPPASTGTPATPDYFGPGATPPPITPAAPSPIQQQQQQFANQQPNPYVAPQQPTPASQPAVDDPRKRILESTFGNDPLKAIESWQHAQRLAAQTKAEKDKLDQVLSKLDEATASSPVYDNLLQAIVEKKSVDEIRKLIGGASEPASGQPNPAPVVPTQPTNIVAAREQELAAAGFLDLRQKALMTPTEWQIVFSDAQTKYSAQQAANLTIKQLEERQRQDAARKTEESLVAIGKQRFQAGFDRAVREYGFDFAGTPEGQVLYQKAFERQFAYRDPQDLRVIREDAFVLAAIDVAREMNIPFVDRNSTQQRQQLPQQRQVEPLGSTGARGTSPQTQEQPKSYSDLIRQARVERYNDSLAYRNMEIQNSGRKR